MDAPRTIPRTSDVKVDPRVGGEFEIVMHTPNGSVPHTGAYQEITRPRRIVFTWNSPYAGNHGSLVTVDFNAKGRSTEIVITHERLPSAEMVTAHSGGWTSILETIARAYVGAPLRELSLEGDAPLPKGTLTLTEGERPLDPVIGSGPHGRPTRFGLAAPAP